MTGTTEFHRSFLKNRNGSVAIGWIAAFTMLTIGAGGALDYSRSVSARQELQRGLDSAMLTAAAEFFIDGHNSDDTTNRARSLLVDGVGNGPTDAKISELSIQFDEENALSVGYAVADVRSIFGALFGKSKIEVDATTTVAFDASDSVADIGMMLDVSGSMSGANMVGLRNAVGSFLNEVIGVDGVSEDRRVALAPFSTSINAGSFASSLIGTSSGTNCIGDRRMIGAFDDPAMSNWFFDVDGNFGISNDENDGVYREGSFNGFPVSGLETFDVSTLCPSAEIFPLSGSYNELSAQLSTYDAEGITGGHLGIHMAWLLISEKWSSFWPTDSRPKSANDAEKIVVLMTDGEFNTYFEATNDLPNDQGRALCDAMRAEGVTVYAVSYNLDGNSEELMRHCVTSEEFFYEPDEIDELIAAFTEIGQKVNPKKLRLIN